MSGIQGKISHEIKDQLEHVVSVHDLFYFLKSMGFFVSYRAELILTSLLKLKVSSFALKSRLLHCIFHAVQQVIIEIYIYIYIYIYIPYDVQVYPTKSALRRINLDIIRYT